MCADGTADKRFTKTKTIVLSDTHTTPQSCSFYHEGSGFKIGRFTQKSIEESVKQWRQDRKCECPNFVAVDCGHDVPIAAVRHIGGGVFQECFVLSKAQYYHDIGCNERSYVLQMRKKAARFGHIQQIENALANHSLKTCVPAKFDASLLQHLNAAPALYAFYGSLNTARWRFNYYKRKQRVLDKVCCCIVSQPLQCVHALAPKRSDVIVVGDAVFPSTFRGSRSGVAHKIMKYAARVRRVIAIWEFLTTKRCSVCCKETHPNGKYRVDPEGWHASYLTQPPQQRPWKEGQHFSYRIRGLTQCRICGRTWHRDVNAALNIGACFYSLWTRGERPSYLGNFCCNKCN